jgi:hypothetical protein
MTERLDHEWLLTPRCSECGLEIERRKIKDREFFQARGIPFCSADCYRPWRQRAYDRRIAELLNCARWWMAKLQGNADPVPHYVVLRKKRDYEDREDNQDREEGKRVKAPPLWKNHPRALAISDSDAAAGLSCSFEAYSDAECIKATRVLRRLHRWQARAYARDAEAIRAEGHPRDNKRPIHPLLDQWATEWGRHIALHADSAAIVALLLGTRKLPGKKASAATEELHREIIVAVARKWGEGMRLLDAMWEVAETYGLSFDWVKELYESRRREANAAQHQI